MRPHPSVAYLSSREPILRRPRLFRTAELNAVGWAAVAGLCLTGVAVGLAATVLTGVTTMVTVPAGGVTAVAMLVGADRRKWAAMVTGYSWTDDLAATRSVADEIGRAGVAVSVGVNGLGRPALRYRNRDHRRVRRVLRDAGLPPPLRG